MRSGRFCGLVICVLLLAACNLVAPPQPVVLTVQPTVTAMPTLVAQDATPSPTVQASARPTQSSTPRASATARPTQTNTPPPTPTSTFTALASSTARPTATPTASLTPTNTPLPTNTARATNTATQTPSVTPTARPTNTATPVPSNTPIPTVTPIPLPATATRPPTNTPTPILSPTPAPTVTPAPTAIPTIDATRIANGLGTQAALLTLEARPSWTAVPQSSATNTLAPTQNATPTLVTATPGGDAIISNGLPVPSTPQPVVGAPTTTPLPTLVPPTVFITPVPPPLSFAPGLNNTSLAQGNFNVPPGGFIFNGVPVGGSVVRFAANPAFPGSYARTDTDGVLHILPPNSTQEVTVSDRVTDIVWSSDGQLAYTIYTEAVSKDNGVHVWSNGQDIPVQTDCPTDQHDPCGQVSDKVVNNWHTIRMEWSSDNRYILTTNIAQTAGGARLALAMSPLGKSPTIAPYLWFFSSGHFLSDNRIVVSGENMVPEAPAPLIVGIVSPSDEGRLFNPAQMQILLDSAAQGVWVEAVVQTANGEFVGFGCTPCNATSKGALALGIVANGTWTPLTQPIGSTSPPSILWSPDRRQAVLTVDGQQFIVDVATRAVTGLASAP